MRRVSLVNREGCIITAFPGQMHRLWRVRAVRLGKIPDPAADEILQRPARVEQLPARCVGVAAA